MNDGVTPAYSQVVAGDTGYSQMQEWRVCQVCGRLIAASRATDDWLVQPHRENPRLTVVRCPEHWSEWALRQTANGRTVVMLAKMQALRDNPPTLSPVALFAPFPFGDVAHGDH